MRRGRTLSSGARGAKQTTPHSTLQQFVDVTLTYHLCSWTAPRRQPNPTERTPQETPTHTACATRTPLYHNPTRFRSHTTEPTKAPSQLFAALNLPQVTSNGEVEGPAC